MQLLQADVFTFLGEKLLGVFACRDELSRNFTQKLDDQCNVICRDAEKTNKRQTGEKLQHKKLQSLLPVTLKPFMLA